MMKKKLRKWIVIVVLSLQLLGISACTSDYAGPKERALTADDFVGTWQVDYADLKFNYHARLGLETFTFKDDGTYQQVFEKPGYLYTSPWNRWNFGRLEDGNVQLYLQGARHYRLYLDGLASAQNPNKGMRDIPVTLNVRVLESWRTTGAPGEVVLQHQPIGDPDAPKIVEFHRIPLLIVPTATPIQ